MKPILFFVAFSVFLFFSCKEEKKVDISQLKGKWELPQEPNATLEISDSFITYPKLHQKHRYELSGDSLIYIYFDMDSTLQKHEFGIQKLNSKVFEVENGTEQIWQYRRLN